MLWTALTRCTFSDSHVKWPAYRYRQPLVTRDWHTQWYSNGPLACRDLQYKQCLYQITDRWPCSVQCPRPPVIHDGWYRWSFPAVVAPPQSRDIREQESAAASHGAAAWTARPTQSCPLFNEFTALWKESVHWHDRRHAAVHKTKRQAVSSVYNHATSQFSASIVRYIDSCLQTWAIKLVCNKRKSALSESIVTESFYTEFNRNSAGAKKRSVLTECPLYTGPL